MAICHNDTFEIELPWPLVIAVMTILLMVLKKGKICLITQGVLHMPKLPPSCQPGRSYVFEVILNIMKGA